jgi:subtilisin family serine protease
MHHLRRERRLCTACLWAQGMVLTLAALFAGCAALPIGSTDAAAAAVTGDDYIIVAVDERPEARARPGAAARGAYAGGAGYAAGSAALDAAAALAAEHRLVEVKAWTIQALNWRCMLYRVPGAAQRTAVLQRLTSDERVRLAQPLQSFQTLATPVPPGPHYNDPYLPLQAGFAAIDAGGAQRRASGLGVTVAVIDTLVDVDHPDLQGRVAMSRDFVGRSSAGESHGTEVAGVIAAVANNRLGIAGVAPGSRLLALRSCWAGEGGEPARCNSFTLAQGLVAAVAEGADVINLSLAGPSDPLLEALTRQAMLRGVVVVAALPASGRREGFPSALPGVLTAASSEDGAAPAGVLPAPGRQVLTLAAGGGYDFVNGSSMASAHLSGAVALLRSRDRHLDSTRLAELLAAEPGQPIDACRALQRLSRDPTDRPCVARPAARPDPDSSAARWPVQAPARP